MKKINGKLKQNAVLTDDKGNFMEFIGSKESRLKGLSRILGEYCLRMKSEIPGRG